MKVPYTKCGKCGDTVYQRNRFGQISYPYLSHIPANPNTVAQKLVRANFGAVAKRWRCLTEDQRQVWLRESKTKKTRRRLGQQFRLGGFNYFVKVNVALANRGLPQMDLPPFDSLEAQLALPLVTRRLHLPLGQFAPPPSASTGHAPPRTG